MELCGRHSDVTAAAVLVVLMITSCLLAETSATTDSHQHQPCKLTANYTKHTSLTPIDRKLAVYVDELFSMDRYIVMPGVEIERVNVSSSSEEVQHCKPGEGSSGRTGGTIDSVEEYFYRKWDEYSNEHAVAVNIPETARFFKSKKTIATGKSSFLAGFGMGFLAFALKKLLLPVFIGAQLIKSVLIAMFLPSILGSLGKIVGKGLSTFSGVSGSSAGLGAAGQQPPMEEFEFKDTSPYGNDDSAHESSLKLNAVTASSTISPKEAMSRFGFIPPTMNRLTYNTPVHTDSNYYFNRHSASHKKNDFKVFHKIPASSLLLTTYDPFYSPLLSRLDAVFQQLGLAVIGRTAAETERCRERLVCMMYANPAKYAPYSNLVSAQLSRELNELRKPSSDNPEILRFFKYMKAAKDGQDGEECVLHGGCPSLTGGKPAGPAMITTYNDINKLVLARKLSDF